LKEIKRYNQTQKKFSDTAESIFLSQVIKEHPEFEALFEKHKKEGKNTKKDLVQYIEENSEFLNKKDNGWMKLVMDVVRDTGQYFEPQIRDSICNEGWASYWHEKLFLKDERLKRNETSFAKLNAGVMSLSPVGLNPYAVGWRLLMHIEELAEKGRISYDFQRIKDVKERKEYDKKLGKGKEFLFKLREDYNDFMLVNTFVDQEFVDKYDLFVVGKRINLFKGVMEYYIRSRNAEDYKKMLLDNLYHPPHIKIDETKAKDGELYLDHQFEEKPLVNEFIPMTMMGIEYLWGKPVKLETSEMDEEDVDRIIQELMWELFSTGILDIDEFLSKQDIQFRRVLYTMENRKLSKKYLDKVEWRYSEYL